MRNLGSDYAALEDKYDACNFLLDKIFLLRLYPQVLTVETVINTFPNIRMKFDYNIYNASEVLVASGRSALVFVDEAKRKPVNPPAWFLDCFGLIFNNVCICNYLAARK
ncbi:MAG: hypothetical protein U5L09_05925 [Bacteroidales bacterium]|nr:hypothetical protein [Bacteroidales bacterium]